MRSTLSKYKIKSIAFIKISPNHVPYYAYMIVEGPRGGEYIVDEFNTELILKTHYNVNIMPYLTTNVMRRIGNELDIIKYIPLIHDLDSYILRYSPNHLCRRQGIAMAKNIGNKLDLAVSYIQIQ